MKSAGSASIQGRADFGHWLSTQDQCTCDLWSASPSAVANARLVRLAADCATATSDLVAVANAIWLVHERLLRASVYPLSTLCSHAAWLPCELHGLLADRADALHEPRSRSDRWSGGSGRQSGGSGRQSGGSGRQSGRQSGGRSGRSGKQQAMQLTTIPSCPLMAILSALTRCDRGLQHIADDARVLLVALRLGSDRQLDLLTRAPVAPDMRLHLLSCQGPGGT